MTKTYSTVNTTRYSKKVTTYEPNTTLDLIKIQNVDSEQRVRGQIKHSCAWVSIQNTNTGCVFMKPFIEVTDAHNAFNLVLMCTIRDLKNHPLL